MGVGILAAVSATLMSSASALAAPGDLDRSFSGNGVVLASKTDRRPGAVSAVAAQAGGSIIRTSGSALIRLSDDGEIDRKFGSAANRALKGVGPGSAVQDIAVDGHDRLLVLSRVEDGETQEATLVATRLTPDGSLDRSFGAGGRVAVGSASLGSIAVNGAGQIAVAAGSRITRLLDTGATDPAFSDDGSVVGPGDFLSVAIRPGGEVVGLDAEVLRQFSADGQPDPAFGDAGAARVAGPPDSSAFDFTLGPDGSSYVGLTICIYGFPSTCSSVVFKLSADGTKDFDYISHSREADLGDGRRSPGAIRPNTMAVDAAGRVTLSLPDLDHYFGLITVARLGPDGSPDPAFGGGDGVVVVLPGGCLGNANGIALDSGGRPLVAIQGCERRGVMRLSSSNGRANLDADPFRDDEDRCFRFPSTAHHGCGVSRRKLTIGNTTRGHVAGKVRSTGLPPADELRRIPPPFYSSAPCVRYLRVRLSGQRRGRERVLARTTASYRGRFRFGGRLRPGKYRVRVRAAFTHDSTIFGETAYCAPAKLNVRVP